MRCVMSCQSTITNFETNTLAPLLRITGDQNPRGSGGAEGQGCKIAGDVLRWLFLCVAWSDWSVHGFEFGMVSLRTSV